MFGMFTIARRVRELNFVSEEKLRVSVISEGKLYRAKSEREKERNGTNVDSGDASNWLRPRCTDPLKALVSNKKHSLTFRLTF